MWLDSCESSISQMSFSLLQGNILPTRAASHFLQIWWRCEIFSNRDTFLSFRKWFVVKVAGLSSTFLYFKVPFFLKRKIWQPKTTIKKKLHNMQTSVWILRWEDRDEVKLAHWSSVGCMPHTWSTETDIQAPCRWTQHFLCTLCKSVRSVHLYEYDAVFYFFL